MIVEREVAAADAGQNQMVPSGRQAMTTWFRVSLSAMRRSTDPSPAGVCGGVASSPAQSVAQLANGVDHPEPVGLELERENAELRMERGEVRG